MTKKKKVIFSIAAFFLLCVAVIFFFWSKTEERKIVTFQNGVTVKAEVADNSLEWTRGLGGRKAMGESEGMLFIFPRTETHSFWMKDMRFPLDFIWIRGGKVVFIHENIDSRDQSALYHAPIPVDAVLEVNAGFVSKNGIKNDMTVSRQP